MPASLLQDHALLALLALLLNLLLGSLPIWHTAAGPGLMLLRRIERKLNRERRPEPVRRRRGTAAACIFLGGALLMGALLNALFHALHLAMLLQFLLLALLIPVCAPVNQSRAIARHLRADDLPAARRLLAGSIWRNHMVLDAHGLARACIETMAVRFASWLLPMLFWWLLLGLPGLLMSHMLCLMSAAWHPQRAHFSQTSYRLQCLLHYLPERLGVLLIATAALCFPFAKPVPLLRMAALSFASPDSEAAPVRILAAGAHLSLGGPLSPYQPTWTGDGTPKPGPREIQRCIWIVSASGGFLLLLLALLAY